MNASGDELSDSAIDQDVRRLREENLLLRGQLKAKASGDSDLANRLNMLARVVENSTDFIGIARMDMKAIFVNRAGRRLMGLSDDYDVGQTQVLDYFPKSQHDKVLSEVVPSVEGTGYWEGELSFQNFKTGVLIPVIYNIFPIRDSQSEQVIAYATVTRNITERKKFEDQLQKTICDLQAERTLRDQFVAALGHDLRSPLTSIRMCAQLMGSSPLNVDFMKDMSSRIVQTVDRADQMIRDLLDASRLKVGEPL